MEAASADLISAQADLVRTQARTMENNPELFWGWNNYRYWGYMPYGSVDPSYYLPYTPVPQTIRRGYR
jgi:hypothetical protein